MIEQDETVRLPWWLMILAWLAAIGLFLGAVFYVEHHHEKRKGATNATERP